MSPRIVVITVIIPEQNPSNAGEKLVWNLCRALSQQGGKITLISDTANSNEKKQTDHETIIVAEPERKVGSALLKRLRTSIDSWTPNLEFWQAIASDSRAREAIEAADIIDLQWSSMVLLAPLIRRLNPRARIIGTYHDINSQRLYRRALYEKNPLKSMVWKAQGKASAFLENLVISSLDQLVVLSEKDAALIHRNHRRGSKVQVVSAPVFDPYFGELAENRDLDRLPTFVLMGSMYRWENQDSLNWLAKSVMPLVWQKIPQVQLHVVGPAAPELFEGLDSRIIYQGVVDSIADAYSGAWAALVPLKLGAGVKFKTVDALLSGVPVISTYAGAEGIAHVSWITKIAESPQRFALAMIDIVENQPAYAAEAQKNVPEVAKLYGVSRFNQRVKEVYGL